MLPDQYMPTGVLGMTDIVKIWLRDSLKYLDNIFVTTHEKEA